MTVVALTAVEDRTRYGGKAHELGRASRAGLPVPDGLAVPHGLLDDIVAGDEPPDDLLDRVSALEGPYVVRSSGVGEDSDVASFAGQHQTALNVTDPDAVLGALEAVHCSARSEAVMDYREQVGIDDPPRMGAVVQTLIRAETAGVLFTRHPVSGADERVVEAAWGLGEAVVDGLVTPDSYRLDQSGSVIDRQVGEKDVRVVPAATGGTSTEAVPSRLRDRPCLSDGDLRDLARLADACESLRPGGHDVEWAIADDQLYLLQRRAITT